MHPIIHSVLRPVSARSEFCHCVHIVALCLIDASATCRFSDRDGDALEIRPPVSKRFQKAATLAYDADVRDMMTVARGEVRRRPFVRTKQGIAAAENTGLGAILEALDE